MPSVPPSSRSVGRRVGVRRSAVSLLLTAGCVTALVACGGDDGTASSASTGSAADTVAPTSATASPSSTLAAPTEGGSPSAASGGTITFEGVSVAKATDLQTAPVVTSSSSAAAKGLAVQDLVVGDGAAPAAGSTVEVRYVGALYSDGTVFDSSWQRGDSPVSFPLQGVVPGFRDGIGGADGIEPMKVGGRRLIIFPAELGYGAQELPGLPANSSLVFVVDLTAVS